jgi:hypothetical protein
LRSFSSSAPIICHAIVKLMPAPLLVM